MFIGTDFSLPILSRHVISTKPFPDDSFFLPFRAVLFAINPDFALYSLLPLLPPRYNILKKVSAEKTTEKLTAHG